MFRAHSVKLGRKLGPFGELPFYVPPLNELFALLAGAKPLIFDTVAAADLEDLRKVCSGLKLRILPFEDRTLGAGRTFALIGKDQRLLRKAALAYTRQMDNYMEWGTALGYPACCVESLRAWSKKRRRGAYRPDIVEFVYDNTPPAARLPFYTNNVFNYFSRPGRGASAGYDAKDRAFGQMVCTLNSPLRFSLLPVISWHPCSYLCAESLRKGRLIFEMMRHHVPDFAEQRRQALSKPVFFVDKYAFAVLDGSPRAAAGWTAVDYRGLFPVRSLLGRRYLDRLARNSTITREGECLRLGGRKLRPLFTFSKAPLLLPFS